MSEDLSIKSRIAYYLEQKNARMGFYDPEKEEPTVSPKPVEELSSFASRVLETKFNNNTLINGQPPVPKARVESSFTASPMTPMKFDAPKGRGGRAGSGEEASTIFAVSAGAFYSLYVIASGVGAGDTYLQGGSVTGGNGGSKTIADYKVIDAGTGPTQPAGTILYMKAKCTATVTDGIMLPGCELTGASTDLFTGASIPDNDTFTVDSKEGFIYAEIGRWTADNFLASSPGNIHASGCIGNFQLSRE